MFDVNVLNYMINKYGDHSMSGYSIKYQKNRAW